MGLGAPVDAIAAMLWGSNAGPIADCTPYVQYWSIPLP